METNKETKYNKLIVVLSVAIPAVVALLFGVNLRKMGFDVQPLSFLPPIYATINGLTAFVLIGAVVAIKNGNRKLHENLMKTAIACSVAFLGMYVAYHMTSDNAEFGGEGAIKYVYYFILITHILLSIIIIPLVLTTYVKALSQRFDKHKKIAPITFPIRLYIAITNDVEYIMISKYYMY